MGDLLCTLFFRSSSNSWILVTSASGGKVSAAAGCFVGSRAGLGQTQENHYKFDSRTANKLM